MKTFINIVFVYIPFAVCVFIQAILLLSLYSDETGVALLAKWSFPFITAAAIVLHYLNKKKKNDRTQF